MSLSKTTWAPPEPALVIHIHTAIYLPRFQYRAGAARGQAPSTPSPRPSHCPGPALAPRALLHAALALSPDPTTLGRTLRSDAGTLQPRGCTCAPVHTICLRCQGVLLPTRHTLCRSPGFSGLFLYLGALPHTPSPWHPWTLSSICSAWGLCWVSHEFLSLHQSGNFLKATNPGSYRVHPIYILSLWVTLS